MKFLKTLKEKITERKFKRATRMLNDIRFSSGHEKYHFIFYAEDARIVHCSESFEFMFFVTLWSELELSNKDKIRKIIKEAIAKSQK